MKPSIIVFLAIIAFPLTGFATHLRGGQIRVIPVNSTSLTCRIELTVYTNTSSEIRFGEGHLDFGDGSSLATPTVQNTDRPDIFPGLGMVTYSVVHTYATTGKYLITYEEPNLNGGILNMQNSLTTRFHMESFIVLTEDHDFTSPEFPAEPIFLCRSGFEYSFSTAAIDESAGEFFYKYEVLKNSNYLHGYEVPGNLSINKQNGIVTWDTKFHDQYLQGEFFVMVKIYKYRNNGDYLGYVMRVMQIIVEDSQTKLDLTSSVDAPDNKVVVTDGNKAVVKVLLSGDGMDDKLRFEMFVGENIKPNVSLVQYDSIAEKKYRVGKISINTTSDIITDNPYSILVRAIAEYRKDISFLYMTKDVPLPEVPDTHDDDPEVVTAVEDEPVKSLNVYPNPFRSELYVDGVEAVITNQLGQVVMQSQLRNGEPINTSSLPGGLYVLKVVGEDRMTRTVKVIRN